MFPLLVKPWAGWISVSSGKRSGLRFLRTDTNSFLETV